MERGVGQGGKGRRAGWRGEEGRVERLGYGKEKKGSDGSEDAERDS